MRGAHWILVALLVTSCASRPEGNEPPICSLSGPDLDARLGEIDALFETHVREVEELPHGFALRFEGGHAAHDAVTDLARREALCCPLLTFEIDEPRDGSFQVRVLGAKDFVRAHLVDGIGQAADLGTQGR